jgi:myo-inositol-1(or 4)-monophosphatase
LTPGAAILSEEAGATGPEGGARWIVDPLDGTVNFLHAYPVFAVSIALQVAGETQVGVVYDPMRDEVFAARRGQPATLNDEPMTVSNTSDLIHSMVTTGFAYDLNERMEAIPLFARFVEHTQAVRRDGSAALNLVYVACGRFDGYWELPIAPWDVAAGALILQEAGGLLSGYAGQPFDPFAREIVASNGVLHPHLLRVIAEQSAS